MANEIRPDPLEGTILRVPGGRDDWRASRRGCHAECSLPDVVGVMVNFAGEVIYATRGERGAYVWWFAGVGEVRE